MNGFRQDDRIIHRDNDPAVTSNPHHDRPLKACSVIPGIPGKVVAFFIWSYVILSTWQAGVSMVPTQAGNMCGVAILFLVQRVPAVLPAIAVAG